MPAPQPIKFLCESGHRGMVAVPVRRCPKCNAPVRLTKQFVAIASDEAKSARMRTVLERVPGLDDVFAEVARAIHNVCAVEGVTIVDLSPQLIVSPRGVMVIELLSEPQALQEVS